MKKLLSLLLFVPFFGISQVKTFSPSGTRISLTPSTTISGSTSETTLFTDVIPANSLVQGKYYPFRIDLAISTPLVNLATLTLKVKYGSGTVSVINIANLNIGVTNAVPITITGYLVSRGMNSQFLPVTVSQGMGTVISLSPTNSQARGLLTVDASVDQNFSITAQFGGVGGAACTLVTDWILRGEY